METGVRRWLISRGAALLCGIVVFITTVVWLCGPNSGACFAVMATDGVVALIWICSAALLGWTILRRCFGEWNPFLAVAASGGLGLGIYSLLGLGLGLAGALNHPVAIGFPAGSVFIFVGDFILRRPAQVRTDRAVVLRWLSQPAGTAWLWIIPVVSLSVACVSASLLPGILWKPLDPHPYDVTSYHLLVPREWFEGGRIVPLSHNVFSYFPFNVEMQFLLLMHAMGGPWAAMYGCQFISVGYAALMVLAIAGSGVGSSKNRGWAAMIGAGLASLVPWTVMLAGVAYVESALMLYTALAIAIVMMAMEKTASRIRLLALAGAMTGFACGTKITAVPMLMLPAMAGISICLWPGEGIRRGVKQLVYCQFIFGGIAVLVLSPWLIRNFFWSGNPLFPIGMHLLGHGAFTSEQVQRFVAAHSPTVSQQTLTAKVEILWNDVISYWQFGYVMLPTALVALAACWRDRRIVLPVISGIGVLVVWIGFTHLLPRFLVMLIPIAGIAIAQVHWRRAWLAGLVLLCLGLVNLGRYVVPELQLHSNPATIDGQFQPAMFGIEDTSAMNSTELNEALKEHLQVGLVGNAQAFLYNIPMSRLHYRSVFDVGTGDAIDAWVGPQVKGDANWLLVVSPSEIERLHRTYVGMPSLPPEWKTKGEQSFYLRGSELVR